MPAVDFSCFVGYINCRYCVILIQYHSVYEH
jgi:hypothetical protein